jgi:hypothetical protein
MPCLAFQLASLNYDAIESEEVARRNRFWSEVSNYGSGYKPKVEASDLTHHIAIALNKAAVQSEGLLSGVERASSSIPNAPHHDREGTSFPTLMIQVKDTGESSVSRQRFMLIPELQGADPSMASGLTGPEWEPRDNVLLENPGVLCEGESGEVSAEGKSNSFYFGHCLQPWLQAARACASQLEGTPEITLEFFLPTDYMCIDINSLTTQARPGRSRPRSLVSSFQFMIRSLDRALDQETSIYELAQKWKSVKAGSSRIVVEREGPPPEASSSEAILSNWSERFFARVNHSQSAACVYLQYLPKDPVLRAEVLGSIIDANLPILLIWQESEASGGVSQQERYRLGRLLLGLPEEPFEARHGDGAAFYEDVALDTLDIRVVAARRKALYSDNIQGINSVVVLMDVPERWPRKTVDVRTKAADRVRLLS